MCHAGLMHEPLKTVDSQVIKKTALKAGKTKSAFILEAVDEKLGLVKNREKTIRELAGWLSHRVRRDH